MEEKQTEEKREVSNMPGKSNSNVWMIAVVVIAVIIGVFYFSRGSENSTDLSQNPPISVTTEPPTADGQSMMVFEISAKPFEFSMKEIKVRKGDKVRINFTSAQGMHDWVLDEFNAKTKVVQTGQSDSIEFVADKTGTFEYYCSVPTHRQQGMIGKFIVE